MADVAEDAPADAPADDAPAGEDAAYDPPAGDDVGDDGPGDEEEAPGDDSAGAPDDPNDPQYADLLDRWNLSRVNEVIIDRAVIKRPKRFPKGMRRFLMRNYWTLRARADRQHAASNWWSKVGTCGEQL